MSHALPALLLGVCIILGLVLVPLGLPGLWVMVAGIVGYGWLTDFRSIGVATIAVVLGLAFLGEIIEAWLGFRFARTFGGSRRSAWGALVGGIVGAAMGVPVPILGSVLGAFRSEEHTSELQSRRDLVCRLLLEKKKVGSKKL